MQNFIGNLNFLSKVSQIWLKSRVFLKKKIIKLSQKIDLNMSEYLEFYGDHVFLVQMIPNIAQISIFTNFIKNRNFHILHIFCILKKNDSGPDFTQLF